MPVPPPAVRRIVYLGSPPLAVPTLEAIVAAGYEVPLVVSRPDRRRGRGSALLPSAVKAAAQDLGIATSDAVDDAATVGADLAVVVAYGRLIKPDLLARLPFVNLHFSLLPRWRGAAPVERALLAGDAGIAGKRIHAGAPAAQNLPAFDSDACAPRSIGPLVCRRGTAR